MSAAWAMLVGLCVPFVGFALLMWLTHLEETLPVAVEQARREPAPAPILAIPVTPMKREIAVRLPEQRAPQPIQAFSRSATLSLGGSTKR